MSVRKASAAFALLFLAGFAPQASAEPVAEIARPDFLAEGVAVTPKGAILVSGVQGRTILKLTADGAQPWLKGPATGGLFGMAVDARRNRLWVAQTGGDKIPGGSGPRTAGVLEVRLSDGRVLSRHPAPDDGKPHWIGDLIVAADGTVYASDSAGGDVYRLRPGARGLERLARTGLASPQGLALTADGAGLILADYSTGLHRIEIASGAVGPVIPAGDAELRGVDGLTRHGRDLIATQNGTSRHRVLRLRFSPDERTIASVDILAVGLPELEDVSLGAVDGGRFVFVARSGWAAFGEDGQPNGKPRPPSLVAAIPLG